MTLSFSTTWPDRMGYLAGQPNYFPYKILEGLFTEGILDYDYQSAWIETNAVSKPRGVLTYPKLHTIRSDKHNRWKPGMKIHPVINNRTKDRFQFAPIMECKSVQGIEITPTERYGFVRIDGRELDMNEIIELARNDGFPSVEAFFMYFNDDFSGKLIHWADLKY